jgi:branched-subunit amino acid transport protein
VSNEAEHQILRPQKWTEALAFLVVSACAAVSIRQILEGDHWIWYASAALSLLFAVVGVIPLLPTSYYLRLSKQGFSIVAFAHVHDVPWRAINRFFVTTIKDGWRTRKMVALNVQTAHDRATLNAVVRRSDIDGCDGLIPDTFGMSPETLADYLNARLQYFRETEDT